MSFEFDPDVPYAVYGEPKPIPGGGTVPRYGPPADVPVWGDLIRPLWPSGKLPPDARRLLAEIKSYDDEAKHHNAIDAVGPADKAADKQEAACTEYRSRIARINAHAEDSSKPMPGRSKVPALLEERDELAQIARHRVDLRIESRERLLRILPSLEPAIEALFALAFEHARSAALSKLADLDDSLKQLETVENRAGDLTRALGSTRQIGGGLHLVGDGNPSTTVQRIAPVLGVRNRARSRALLDALAFLRRHIDPPVPESRGTFGKPTSQGGTGRATDEPGTHDLEVTLGAV